jgi:hypothetical protein
MEDQILHIHYQDGPDSIRVVTLGGWIGEAFVVPRSDISKLFKKENLNRSGFYFLFGENGVDKRKLYIGESELLDGRINNQDRDKDFWEVAVIFTNGLDGSKSRYLENKSLKLSRIADRFLLQNRKGAESDTLAPYSKVEAHQYFAKCSFILTALGFPVFDKVEKKMDSKEYVMHVDDISASGFLTEDQGFVIKSGSSARLNSSAACPPGVVAIRAKLLDSGILKEDEGKLLFTKDEYFSSVSTAAAVVRGTAANGWDCWEDENGKTLNEIVQR